MALKNIDQVSDGAIELSEIQGDVLVGLQKKVEAFLLFDIADVQHFKVALKGALGRIVFSDEAARREAELIALDAAHLPKPNYIAANVLFSKNGLSKLASLHEADLGAAFSRSVHARDALLLDPASAALPGFKTTSDGVLLITTADEASLTAEVSSWRAIFGHSITETHFEIGRVRPGSERGHEHFGFLDGVSQPGVEGLTPSAQHAPGKPAGKPDQGLPGQDLIKPGAFVFGYQNQDGTQARPPLPWMRNGSFMVLRRLEQQVEKFHSFLGAAAAAKGVSPEMIGAQLVGRWQSGAPIMIATDKDDEILGADIFRNNDFDFNGDRHQAKCPFLGHIRKSYPRDDLDFTPGFPKKGDGEEFAESHRILRAGIPFGFEVNQDPGFGDGERVGHEASRGLMFVCYQSSIEAGFEFIQSSWCNEPSFVTGKSSRPGGPTISPGIDLIIGQTAVGPRFGDLSSMNTDDVISDVPTFVTPTGTGYYFSPSRTALTSELT